MLEMLAIPPPTQGIKHKAIYFCVFDTTKKTMYTDQTGCFPINSTQGHKYIMVAVKLDDNYIDAESNGMSIKGAGEH